MAISCFILIFNLFFVNQIAALERPLPCQEMTEYAEDHLPAHGFLKQDEKGFVYVDIEDAYIHALIPFIKEEGFEEPPYFNAPGMHGAHISVIYAEEAKKYHVPKLTEVGMDIPFKITGCKDFRFPEGHNWEKAYVLLVDAPKLAIIRKKYGLPPSKYGFHITVGIKEREVKKAA